MPTWYIPQVQIQMAVTGLPKAELVPFFGGSDLRWFEIPADAELQGILIERAEQFWRDHIETGKPPAMDDSNGARDYLLARYPRNSGVMLQADGEVLAMISDLRLLQSVAEQAERDLETLKNQLRERIGDADGFSGPGFKVTWKRSKDRERIDWESLVTELKPDSMVVSRHTHRTPGPRVFRAWFKGEQ